MTSISEQSARHAVEPAWRPRWAVITAWILGVVAALATVILAMALVAAGAWVVVILMMLWPEVVASIAVAGAAITFLLRGGRGWFWVAVGGVAVALVTLIVVIALNS